MFFFVFHRICGDILLNVDKCIFQSFESFVRIRNTGQGDYISGSFHLYFQMLFPSQKLCHLMSIPSICGNYQFSGICFIYLLPDNILRLGYDRLKAMRDAIGPDVDIIVEMHSFTSAAPAIQFGRMIEELGVLYYEEPVMPLNPKMMKQVADHVNIPLASGERIYWRWGYRPFLEDGSLSVIQPDICTCGGISEVKKICDMAHVYDVTVQIHVCGGPISTAAALHMEAAIPNFMIHELHRYALLEPNTRTCIHNYMPSKGRYTVPELPGLGQELTPETIAASDIITVK